MQNVIPPSHFYFTKHKTSVISDTVRFVTLSYMSVLVPAQNMYHTQ